MTAENKSWLQSLAVYRQSRPRIMLFLGFSSGLPILLVFGTLSIWLREAGVDRSTIGFVSWVALAYGFKWVWSPLVDRLSLPFFTRYLGRRRGWLLLSQLSVTLGLVIMAPLIRPTAWRCWWRLQYGWLSPPLPRISSSMLIVSSLATRNCRARWQPPIWWDTGLP